MEYEQILVARRDDVLVLTLNRPERLNGWTPRMIAEMTAAITTAEADLDAVQQRELAALEVSYRTPEHREAVQAFLEKRPPVFTAAVVPGTEAGTP